MIAPSRSSDLGSRSGGGRHSVQTSGCRTASAHWLDVLGPSD